VQQVEFAQDLFPNETPTSSSNNEVEEGQQLNIQSYSNRQSKIRFLVKILTTVSFITDERVDIYVSPAKVLCGQEVHATHRFLQCLAKASKVPPHVSNGEARKVLAIGASVLYKQLVKTRLVVVKLQAIMRGKLYRNRVILHLMKLDRKEIESDDDNLGSNCIKIENVKETEAMTVSLEPELDVLASNIKPPMVDPSSTASTETNGDVSATCSSPSKQIEPLKEPISPDTSDDETDTPCEETPSKGALDGQEIKRLQNAQKNDSMKKQKDGPIKSQGPIMSTHSCTRTSTKLNDKDTKVQQNALKCQQQKDSAKNDSQRDENNIKLKAVCKKDQSTNTCSTNREPERNNSQDKLSRKSLVSASERQPVKKSTTRKDKCCSGTKKEKTKKIYTFVNGIRVKKEVVDDEVNETNVEKEEEKIKEQKSMEEKLKQGLKQLKEQQQKLKHRWNEVKQKEEYISTHEIRINRLAENLRKQQERFKHDRVRQEIEIDRLRLLVSEGPRERPCQQEYPEVEDTPEDLMRRIQMNPTITDFRLKLESKERYLKNREKRLRKLEREIKKERDELTREVVKQSEEHCTTKAPPPFQSSLSRNKRCATEGKKNVCFQDSIGEKTHSREKKKVDDTDTTVFVTSHQERCSDQKEKYDHSTVEAIKEVTATNHRRKVLAQKKNIKTKFKILSKHLNSIPEEIFEKREGKISPLLASAENGVVTIPPTPNSGGDLPKSLLNYSSHYKNVQKQKFKRQNNVALRTL
jgi:hypothetical protein